VTAALVRGVLIGLAVTAVIAAAVLVIRPVRSPGSPNCSPGQWYVDKPGTGWICASGPAFTFTPGYTFAPKSPAGSTP